jgi:hypothetical protein
MNKQARHTAGASREAKSAQGRQPSPQRWRRLLVAAAVGLAVTAVCGSALATLVAQMGRCWA